MTSALEILLDGIIDYAGLFPPAKHDLPRAIEEYLEHLEQPESLLVNRFVCPMGKLGELGDLVDGREEVDFEITAIGSGIDSVAADFAVLEAHRKRFGERLLVTGYECRTGADVRASVNAIRRIRGAELYLEVPLDGSFRDALHLIADSEGVNAKARTGGLEASAFPSSEVLAGFLKECLDLDLTFKLTAGLHHPFRTQEEALNAWMHGFLNIPVALALAEELDLTQNEMVAVLEETDPAAFEFDEDRIGYRGQLAGMDAVEGVRAMFAGFGSCSVLEPYGDLQALGLWPSS